MQQIEMEKCSPMMKHYLETKQAYPDCILFYRLGDFYEMFFEDAQIVAKELQLTLTGKACGLEERAPMCGVPYHASETYLTKLVAKGYKVAICEQIEDPKTAKGMVKRDVIRVVSPGTNLSMQALDEKKHNYLMCIYYQENLIGMAACDITTGVFYVTECPSLKETQDEIARYSPTEIIANEAFFISGADVDTYRERQGMALYPLPPASFDMDTCKYTLCNHFHVHTLTVLGLDAFPQGTLAAGALLQYLFSMQKSALTNFTQIYPYRQGRYMLLDAATRRNLELTETLRDQSRRGSLMWVLDKTMTAMGGRMLRDFIEQPLTNRQEMLRRQEVVAALVQDAATREEIREYLKPIYDLERLMARISYHTAGPRDLLSFGASLRMLPALRQALQEFASCDGIRQILADCDPLTDLQELIASAISEDAPVNIRDGNVILEEFDAAVDHFRAADFNGKQWLIELEEETRLKTGIKNLRIKYNNHFGYAFEVTNSFKDLVPEEFIRRQTLSTCERYTTPRLKELEDTILNAKERLLAAEYEAFVRVRDEIAASIERIQKTAKAVALIDAFASLAHVAERNRYSKPELTDEKVLVIKEGRHPVIEQMMEGSDAFIANDTCLDNAENAIAVITGPNMAGKSTYMRQTALIVLMAQIGSFVPAKEARIGVADRIFTRVGASDDLASGRSTFMVEMSEVAGILRGATSDSLLILDEIGRGTSTCDGLSIARAVVEYLVSAKHLHARTLFATHYHELTSLEDHLPGVKNYCSAVREKEDGVVFLHKIVRGGADKSYGIQVAKLAGVPEEVIERAEELAAEAERETAQVTDQKENRQMTLFDLQPMKHAPHPVVEALRKLKIEDLTPLAALNELNRLQEAAKEE